MCARGEVSSSNKRKVALWILLLLPHTEHLPPTPSHGYRFTSSFSSTTASSSTPWLPLSLVTAPISRFARANSQIANFPRSSRTVRRWRQSQARLWGLRKRKTWRVRWKRRERRESVLWKTLGAEVLMRLIGSRLRGEKIHVEGRVRSKIDRLLKSYRWGRGNSKKFRERLGAQWIENECGWLLRQTTSSRNARRSRTFVIPVTFLPRLVTPISRYCRVGEIDRIWMIPPLFKTDEELSGRSLCLWWTRCAVRGYGGSPRPPIGRERKDREQYRHEGTNYPPTIATTIRTRPPPLSATTPRFGSRDEERQTEPPRQGRCDDEGLWWKERNNEGRMCVRRRKRKNALTIDPLLYFFPFFSCFESIFFSLLAWLCLIFSKECSLKVLSFEPTGIMPVHRNSQLQIFAWNVYRSAKY